MELFKRVLVAIIFIPVLLWVYYSGGLILIGFLGILSSLCTYELIKMYEKKDVKLLFFNIVLSFSLFYSIAEDLLILSVCILFLVLLFNGARDVFWSRCEGSAVRVSGALMSIIYPSVCFGLMFKLGEFHNTLIPVLAVLIWIVDSFAYFIGMLFGKHRGLFRCSPMKSLEGFIAGVVFAFIGSLAVMFIFPAVYGFKHVMMLTIAAGLFGQYGDLFESVIKRDMKVKDSSSLIPGHGGVLDRFDSLLIAAPIMYLLLQVW